MNKIFGKSIKPKGRAVPKRTAKNAALAKAVENAERTAAKEVPITSSTIINRLNNDPDHLGKLYRKITHSNTSTQNAPLTTNELLSKIDQIKFKNELIKLNKNLIEICYKRSNLFLLWLNISVEIYNSFIKKYQPTEVFSGSGYSKKKIPNGLNFVKVLNNSKTLQKETELDNLYEKKFKLARKNGNTNKYKELELEKQKELTEIRIQSIKQYQNEMFSHLTISAYEPFNSDYTKMTRERDEIIEQIIKEFIKYNKMYEINTNKIMLHNLLLEYSHDIQNNIFNYISNIPQTNIENGLVNRNNILFGLFLIIYKNDPKFHKLQNEIYNDLNNTGFYDNTIFIKMNELLKILIEPSKNITMVKAIMKGTNYAIHRLNSMCVKQPSLNSINEAPTQSRQNLPKYNQNFRLINNTKPLSRSSTRSKKGTRLARGLAGSIGSRRSRGTSGSRASSKVSSRGSRVSRSSSQNLAGFNNEPAGIRIG